MLSIPLGIFMYVLFTFESFMKKNICLYLCWGAPVVQIHSPFLSFYEEEKSKEQIWSHLSHVIYFFLIIIFESMYHYRSGPERQQFRMQNKSNHFFSNWGRNNTGKTYSPALSKRKTSAFLPLAHLPMLGRKRGPWPKGSTVGLPCLGTVLSWVN